MTVQIKPLKGFENPLNGENNTLSLLIKSDFKLNKHLLESKQKLLISLTSIINHYKDAHKIHFYHKLLVPIRNSSDYISTRGYKLSLNSLKSNLDDSFENVISMSPNTIYSHFINIIINKDDKVIKLSDDKFYQLNHIIGSCISHINNNEFSLVDNIPFKKSMMKIEKKNSYIEKQTNIINKKYFCILRQHVEYLTI